MNDPIERQAAIDVVESFDILDGHTDQQELIYRIRQLPSAEPELNFDEWCTDCKEYDHEKHCCPRWNRVIRQTLNDAQPEIVHCKDCKHRGEKPISDGRYWCNIHGYFMYYCSDAERRMGNDIPVES